MVIIDSLYHIYKFQTNVLLYLLLFIYGISKCLNIDGTLIPTADMTKIK